MRHMRALVFLLIVFALGMATAVILLAILV